MRVISLFFLLACFSQSVSGQKGIEIGGHLGISHYYGDLNPTFKLSDPGLALGVKFRRNFNERTSLSLGLDYGRISGSDDDSNNAFEKARNLRFKSSVLDFNFGLEFNFFPYVHGSADEYFTPYIVTGFSILSFNPKAEYDGQLYELRDLQTEGEQYSLATGSWFYGLGFKWDYNRDWSFNVTLTGRSTFTDFIDDVSQFYVSPSDPVAAALANPTTVDGHGLPGTQRGNDDTNDKVYFLSIGILKYFGQIQCPPITRGLY